MDFALSDTAQRYRSKLVSFLVDTVLPAESVYRQQLADLDDLHGHPAIIEDLKSEARRLGLWNLFLPHKTKWTDGLANLDYAPLAELSGMSFLSPEAMNCSAPDTGNMEILSAYGTSEQQEKWLVPLLEGEIRSCFAMTEPEVASSDATNIQCSIVRDGDDYVINGRKWWVSGAASSRCKVAIVMGKTDPNQSGYKQQSMVIVPMDSVGLSVVRSLSVFGYQDREGHCELVFNNVRVPKENLLGEEGSGFEIAQSRLGPGRIHHCMRSLGAAERALDLMCKRAEGRETFGKLLSEQGVVQNWIAESRIEIDQARLLTLNAAYLMDTVGNKGARIEISEIKVVAPNVALRVIDRAIQTHGGAGVSDDFPLAMMWAHQRTLRLADGPDEVHMMTIARRELGRHRQAGLFYHGDGSRL